MSSENLLRQFLGLWNAHDQEGAVAMMTDDCIFEPSIGPSPWGDRLVGRNAVRDWAVTTFAKIPDIHWEPIRFFANGNQAVYEYRVTGTPRGAPPLDVFACDIFTLRNDQVYTKRAYRKAKP